MVLPEIVSIVTIADFSERMISRLMKKKKKKSKTRPRQRKQTREQELISKLLINPEQAIKEMGAEYVVKNRKRIIRKIEDYVVDQLE
jgi:hypothetical protein